MKKVIVLGLIASAFSYSAAHASAPASIPAPDDSQQTDISYYNLAGGGEAGIEVLKKHVAISHSITFCEEWHEIDPVLRAIFSDKAYRVTHLVAVPYGSGGAKVCVSAELK